MQSFKSLEHSILAGTRREIQWRRADGCWRWAACSPRPWTWSQCAAQYRSPARNMQVFQVSVRTHFSIICCIWWMDGCRIKCADRSDRISMPCINHVVCWDIKHVPFRIPFSPVTRFFCFFGLVRFGLFRFVSFGCWFDWSTAEAFGPAGFSPTRTSEGKALFLSLLWLHGSG